MRSCPAVACLLVALAALPASVSAQISAAASVSVDPALSDFAARFEKSVNTGDAAAIRLAIDFDALLATAVRGLDAPAAAERAFKDSVKSSVDLGKQLSEATRIGGTYKLLRMRPGQFGRPQALFRLITKDGAVNYHELALKREPSGTVHAVDFYLFTNGEWVSETVRRGWVITASESSVTSQIKRLAGVESDMLKSLPQLKEVNRLQAANQPAEALKAWQQLAPSLQVSKNLLIQRVNLARLVGEAEYNEAVAAFSRAFPSDPSLDLIQVDVFMSKKQYPQAMAAIERIARTVGGDPYLDFLRGNVLYVMKDFAKSRTALAAALATEPTLLGPWWTLVTMAVEEKNHDETARLLTVLEQERGVEMGDLQGVEIYAEFAKSEAYKKWMRSRRK